jgi:hypothetical protein
MSRTNILDFYKNSIESNWSNILTIPDPSKLKESFDRFYNSRKDILQIMSNEFKLGSTKLQLIINKIKLQAIGNKYLILGFLVFVYMVKKYYEDKKMSLTYKKTERNFKILKFLD